MKVFAITLAAFAAILVVPLSSHAQAGLYGEFTASRMGGIQSSPYAAYSAANGGTRATIDISGGTFGGYYDFKTVGPVRLGADVRGVVTRSSRGGANAYVGAGSHLYSALGGVRGSFHTPVKFLEPYLVASAGLGRSDYGLLTQTLNNNFEYHLFGGADLHLTSFLDFRAVELGYGGLEGGSHHYPIRSVATGIVLHFPSVP